MQDRYRENETVLFGEEHRRREPESSGGRSLRYEDKMVMILTAAGGVAALDAQAVFYLMPFIATDFALGSSQIGMIGSAVLVGWAIGGLLMARASDRLGKRKPFLVAAFACFALLSGLSAAAMGFATLLIARILIGLAEGPVIPIKQAIVMVESTPSRRGFNMGIVQNFGAQLLGTLLGPIILIAVAQNAGWRWAFLVAGIPGLIIALLILRFIREPAIAAQAAPSPPSENGQSQRNGAHAWRHLLGNRNLVLCTLIALAAVAWFFVMLTFLPLYLIRNLQFSSSQMSLVMSLIGVAGVISAVIVPAISDRHGRRTAIMIFSAIGAIAPLGALYAGANPWVIGATLLIGCLMLGTFPLIMATVPQESVQPADAATATGLVIAVAQLGGGAIGPILAGWLADRIGDDTPLMLAAGLALIATGIAPFVRETKPPHRHDCAPTHPE
ncbi:Hexuronate transporter [Sphingobium sp. AntQ-1]|uniref:MFS transporter n=1 Tax=Sphingobium sp. AntQ-1 TaxID=2930091 RepID=UPI00234EB198|nr:MFS transporter [Sphingobium sp. AntQ-1]WCP14866.1 Hexuronate transporter [Sphingobium sp. AntQ-1]